MFVFEFCRLCGSEWKNAAPFAGAIEMIHTYSLIHDDLPCMDNDDYRRGRLTNHKVYGEAMAVLAGDALLTDAFALAASAQLPHAGDLGRAVRVLAKMPDSSGMVGGQVLDMLSQTRECSEDEVIAIQSRKTGALVKAACVLGVIVGGGTEEQILAASQFADCWVWRSRFGMICWMSSVMPENWEKQWAWTRRRTPSSGCMALRNAKASSIITRKRPSPSFLHLMIPKS